MYMASYSFLCYACLVISLIHGVSCQTGRVTAASHHRNTVKVGSLQVATDCKFSSTKGYKKSESSSSSLELVHRHKLRTLSDMVSHHLSRVSSIQSKLNRPPSSSSAAIPARDANYLGAAGYVVTVGLGTPKKYFSLIFDTGSELTWTQCQPCLGHCYKQKEPIFDPFKSKTYKNITCGKDTCQYQEVYGDGTQTLGYLAKETLTLTPTVALTNFTFGCGQNNTENPGATTAGLLGLSRDPLSIVYQTASKSGKYFSHCLPTNCNVGHLTFGKGSAASGGLKFTSLITKPNDPSHYFVDMTAIKVGGRFLPISQTVFKAAGTIIDSGTTFTSLPPAAYKVFRSAFRQEMKSYPMVRSRDPPLDTCYDLSKYRTVSIPEISFLFEGNVEVPISPLGVIVAEKSSYVCLTIVGNENPMDTGFFGNIQQRNLEVVYDVAGGKLGFGKGGCS